MDVVIVGGHGQVGLLMSKLLSARGDRVRGVIRKADQAPDLEQVGAEPVIADFVRDNLADAVAGADAVVFAAGSPQGTSAEGKRTIDLGGAVKLIDAAQAGGINRYVLISAIGVRNAEEPPLVRVPLKVVRHVLSRSCARTSRPRPSPRTVYGPAAWISRSSARAGSRTTPPAA